MGLELNIYINPFGFCLIKEIRYVFIPVEETKKYSWNGVFTHIPIF